MRNILHTLETNLGHLREAVGRQVQAVPLQCSRWVHAVRSAVTLVQRTVLADSPSAASEIGRTTTGKFGSNRNTQPAVTPLQLAVDRCGTALTEFEKGFEGLGEQVEMQFTEVKDMLDCQANALSHFREFVASLQKDKHYFSEEIEILRDQNSTNEGYLIKTRQDVVRLIREKEDVLLENCSLKDELRDLRVTLNQARVSANNRLEEQVFDMQGTIEQVDRGSCSWRSSSEIRMLPYLIRTKN